MGLSPGHYLLLPSNTCLMVTSHHDWLAYGKDVNTCQYYSGHKICNSWVEVGETFKRATSVVLYWCRELRVGHSLTQAISLSPRRTYIITGSFCLFIPLAPLTHPLGQPLYWKVSLFLLLSFGWVFMYCTGNIVNNTVETLHGDRWRPHLGWARGHVQDCQITVSVHLKLTWHWRQLHFNNEKLKQREKKSVQNPIEMRSLCWILEVSLSTKFPSVSTTFCE